MDIIATNKKAHFNYTLHDKFEAGLVLRGSEVKSIRAKKVTLTGGFCRIMNNELFMLGIQILPYEQANKMNHNQDRTRKLLLNRREINKIQTLMQQKGMALVVTKMYWVKNKVKVEIATGSGKKMHDKRQTIKERDVKRKIARMSR